MGGLAGEGVRADFARKRASWHILYRGSLPSTLGSVGCASRLGHLQCVRSSLISRDTLGRLRVCACVDSRPPNQRYESPLVPYAAACQLGPQRFTGCQPMSNVQEWRYVVVFVVHPAEQLLPKHICGFIGRQWTLVQLQR